MYKRQVITNLQRLREIAMNLLELDTIKKLLVSFLSVCMLVAIPLEANAIDILEIGSRAGFFTNITPSTLADVDGDFVEKIDFSFDDYVIPDNTGVFLSFNQNEGSLLPILFFTPEPGYIGRGLDFSFEVLFAQPSDPNVLGVISPLQAFIQYDNEHPIYVYLGNSSIYPVAVSYTHLDVYKRQVVP